ncbi:hypothetical protein ElyMa_000145300 [Elysia marginata]|uniref:Uncharacterized protein n=1 Tax=Elysia marginata TaxID=1093978 RepID=A0AAV4EQN4_9GAST|nr:hypothetical protein ElyMa_000145300 [Elysia marginata]
MVVKFMSALFAEDDTTQSKSSVSEERWIVNEDGKGWVVNIVEKMQMPRGDDGLGEMAHHGIQLLSTD